MAAKAVPTWQSKLSATLRRDPKKTGVLTVLAVILIVLCGRGMIGQKANTPPAPGGVLPEAKPAEDGDGFKASGKKDTSAAMRQWLSSTPAKISRNLFAVQLNYYPQPSGKLIRPSNSAELDKLNTQDADELRERQVRLDALNLQAKQFKLQSTLMSAKPRALINGELLKEGDLIAVDATEASSKFRVIKIEPRRVIMECDGEKLDLWMK